jgi:hypothetical protein
MSTQHTPGDWAVFNGTDIFPENDPGGDRHIADCFPVQDRIPYAEREANARLFRAAPAMLKALRAYDDAMTACWGAPEYLPDGNPDAARCWPMARAAIAKATTP